MARSNVAFVHTQALSRWFESIFQLGAKEFGERYQRSAMSALFQLLEPIIIISFLSLTEYSITGRMPWRSALYHTTGVIPFYLFLRLSQRLRLLEAARLPLRATRFDAIVAMTLAEFVSKAVVFIFLMVVFWSVDVGPTFPADPPTCLSAVFILLMLGLGMGFVNNNIANFFPSWTYIYAIGSRMLLVLSGILLRPDSINVGLRNFIVWNPLFQAVTWFRSGFYERFPTYLLDVDYLVVFAFVLLFIGLVLNSVASNWR